MPRTLLAFGLRLALAAWLWVDLPEGFPGREEPSYVKPVGDTQTELIDWVERHGTVLYPALGAFVLALLVIGILQAWRAQDMDGLSKAEFKREIIHELRKQLSGMSGDVIAKSIGLDGFKTAKLLEEMQKDGVLVSHTSTERLTTWRLKGAGPQPQPRR